MPRSSRAARSIELSSTPALSPTEEAERRKRIRRSFIVLALVAAAFYFGFILLAVTRGIHG
jgi:hypothetical protein